MHRMQLFAVISIRHRERCLRFESDTVFKRFDNIMQADAIIRNP